MNKWLLSSLFWVISLGICINRLIFFVGIFILTNWFLVSSLSLIKAAKFRLKLLINGNGCAGSTTNGVNNGKIDEVKKLLHQFFWFSLRSLYFFKTTPSSFKSLLNSLFTKFSWRLVNFFTSLLISVNCSLGVNPSTVSYTHLTLPTNGTV